MVTGVPHYKQFSGEDSSRPHEALERTVRAHGGLWLNSYRELKLRIGGTAQGVFYFPEDPTHFNIAGNALWAEAQLKFLLEHSAEVLPK